MGPRPHASFIMEANMATMKAPQPKKLSPAQLLKEQKIAAYQQRIAQDEEAIVKMEEERSAIAKADVIGLLVSHKTFGNGTITDQAYSSITVKFEFGDKRFIMPSAFVDGFLETESAEMNERFDQYRKLGEQIMTAKEDLSAAARSIQILEKK